MSPSIPLRMEGFLSKSHQFPDDPVGHFDGADEYQHIEYQPANIVPDDRCRGKAVSFAPALSMADSSVSSDTYCQGGFKKFSRNRS